MDQSNNILNLAIEGVRPSKIAEVFNTTIGFVTQHLAEAIHKKRVRRSQVLATLDKQWQNEIIQWFPLWKKAPRASKAEYIHKMIMDTNGEDYDLDIEEVKLYLLCFETAFKDGDMYELLCEIERTLHTKIKMILVAEHGDQEVGWWRKGIPERVRLECNTLRESDKEFDGNPPYSYTTLNNLKEIIVSEKNSAIFKKRLPLGANNKEPNMTVVKNELERLNKIRNRVMHPTRATPPTEDDFFFVKDMKGKYDLSKWR